MRRITRDRRDQRAEPVAIDPRPEPWQSVARGEGLGRRLAAAASGNLKQLAGRSIAGGPRNSIGSTMALSRTPPGRASLLWLLALVCVTVAGLVSVSAGTDRNWDLANYHLYAAYAWLNGRLFFDLLPAQAQTFFNPLLSLLPYSVYTVFQDHPRLGAFVLGVPAGIFAFLFLRIAWDLASLLFAGRLAILLATVVAGAIGLTGVAFAPGIGLTMNDVLAAVPVALAYWIVQREVTASGEGRRAGPVPLVVAGAVAGMAVGLKLTMVPFAAALGLMILLLLGLRAAVAAGVAMLATFVLFWAPHAWALWRETGNPMFPMYNAIFRSPDFMPVSWADERFLPRSFVQAIFYPFWWLVPNQGLVTELRMRDWRVPVGYLSLVALVPLLIWRGRGINRRPLWLLIGVSVLAYAIWAKISGIYRYLAMLEALAVLLLMAALALLFRGRVVLALLSFAAIGAVVIQTTIRPNWGKGPHGAQMVTVPPMPVPEGALVVTLDDEPHSYLVPFMPPSVRVLGLNTNLLRPTDETGLTRRLREAIATHAGPRWSIAARRTTDLQRDAVLNAYGLIVAGACVTVRTSLTADGHVFCPIEKQG